MMYSGILYIALATRYLHFLYKLARAKCKFRTKSYNSQAILAIVCIIKAENNKQKTKKNRELDFPTTGKLFYLHYTERNIYAGGKKLTEICCKCKKYGKTGGKNIIFQLMIIKLREYSLI